MSISPRNSSEDRVKLLIDILFDQHASISERDDAAIELGYLKDERATEALLCAVVTIDDEMLLASCGESIAQHWLHDGHIDVGAFKSMPVAARHEVESLIKREHPDWLDQLPERSS